MLTAIDPDSTETFEVSGATFTLGVVPATVWQRVKFAQIMAYEKAQRKAIRDVAKDGLSPDDKLSTKDGKEVSRVEFIAHNSPEFRAELVSIMLDLLRHGIKGHDGILLPNGEPVPFEMIDSPLEGTVVKVVSPKTMRVYAANTGVMSIVFAALTKRCELGDGAKKV